MVSACALGKWEPGKISDAHALSLDFVHAEKSLEHMNQGFQ